MGQRHRPEQHSGPLDQKAEGRAPHGVEAELHSQLPGQKIEVANKQVSDVPAAIAGTQDATFVADGSKAHAAIASIYNRLQGLPEHYKMAFFEGQDPNNLIIQHLKDQILKNNSSLA